MTERVSFIGFGGAGQTSRKTEDRAELVRAIRRAMKK